VVMQILDMSRCTSLMEQTGMILVTQTQYMETIQMIVLDQAYHHHHIMVIVLLRLEVLDIQQIQDKSKYFQLIVVLAHGRKLENLYLVKLQIISLDQAYHCLMMRLFLLLVQMVIQQIADKLKCINGMVLLGI
jgi:hypothetical protein